jgi:hypothetical protein
MQAELAVIAPAADGVKLDSPAAEPEAESEE